MRRTLLAVLLAMPLCAWAEERTEFLDASGEPVLMATVHQPQTFQSLVPGPAPHRYFFAGGSTGVDAGILALRLGVVPIQELSVELHAGLLATIPVFGADLRVRPLARFSPLTPTVRYGVGLAVVTGPQLFHTVAGGLEWNSRSGLSIGLDAGASFIIDNYSAPISRWGALILPSGQVSIGWRFDLVPRG